MSSDAVRQRVVQGGGVVPLGRKTLALGTELGDEQVSPLFDESDSPAHHRVPSPVQEFCGRVVRPRRLGRHPPAPGRRPWACLSRIGRGRRRITSASPRSSSVRDRIPVQAKHSKHLAPSPSDAILCSLITEAACPCDDRNRRSPLDPLVPRLPSLV